VYSVTTARRCLTAPEGGVACHCRAIYCACAGVVAEVRRMTLPCPSGETSVAILGGLGDHFKTRSCDLAGLGYPHPDEGIDKVAPPRMELVSCSHQYASNPASITSSSLGQEVFPSEDIRAT
jgi:hypothetical protein